MKTIIKLAISLRLLNYLICKAQKIPKQTGETSRRMDDISIQSEDKKKEKEGEKEIKEKKKDSLPLVVVVCNFYSKCLQIQIGPIESIILIIFNVADLFSYFDQVF